MLSVSTNIDTVKTVVSQLNSLGSLMTQSAVPGQSGTQLMSNNFRIASQVFSPSFSSSSSATVSVPQSDMESAAGQSS